jgi:hypothetical protein
MTEHRGRKECVARCDGVLFIAGSKPAMARSGSRITGRTERRSGLRFMCHVEERYDAETDGLVGQEICNRHSDAILDKSLELYLGTAMLTSNSWQTVVDSFTPTG